MSNRHWIVTGYDGENEIFKQTIPEAALSEAEMTTLLQRLASRHLKPDEICDASLRKNTSGYRSDLEINRNLGGRFALMTTGNTWYYTAIISEIDDTNGA
jgi:hypothetical protein